MPYCWSFCYIYFQTLNSLRIALHADWEREELLALVSDAPPLRHVEHLELKHNDYMSGFSMDGNKSLISLFPCIHGLQAICCIGSRDNLTFSNLTSLNLNYCMLIYNDLKVLLQACRQLQIVRYRGGEFKPDEDNYGEEALPNQMVSALPSANNSLRHFEIHWTESSRGEDDDYYDSSGTIKELTSFNLETVVLSLNTLYVARDENPDDSRERLARLCCPPVKHLQIMDADEILYDFVLGLSESVALGRLPELQDVQILPFDGSSPLARIIWEDDEFELLHSRFQKANVRFIDTWSSNYRGICLKPVDN